MAVIHDLRCPECGIEIKNVEVEDQNYPRCTWCGGEMTWMPFVFATDVRGSEQQSQVLEDADGRPLTYTSSRERDQKMKRQGFEPAGDRVGGARSVLGGTPDALPVDSTRVTRRSAS